MPCHNTDVGVESLSWDQGVASASSYICIRRIKSGRVSVQCMTHGVIIDKMCVLCRVSRLFGDLGQRKHMPMLK